MKPLTKEQFLDKFGYDWPKNGKANTKVPQLQYFSQRMKGIADITEPDAYDTGPVLCSTFACARVLSLYEQLAGSKCVGCVGKKEVDINHYIKGE